MSEGHFDIAAVTLTSKEYRNYHFRYELAPLIEAYRSALPAEPVKVKGPKNRAERRANKKAR